jgi:hypothetical protein
MDRIKGLFIGGSAGNEHLTAVISALLLMLLAIEGATLLQIRSLLTCTRSWGCSSSLF